MDFYFLYLFILYTQILHLEYNDSVDLVCKLEAVLKQKWFSLEVGLFIYNMITIIT